MRTLITGGVKSGKSSYALELAEKEFRVFNFLATAEAFDSEMKEKIRLHRIERAERFITVEEPVDIDKAVRENQVLDCIPMWLNNLYFREREAEWPQILGRLVARLPRDIIIVTNETGMGTIPLDPVSRRYHMDLGSVNKTLARECDRVILMVAGLPLTVKGSLA